MCLRFIYASLCSALLLFGLSACSSRQSAGDTVTDPPLPAQSSGVELVQPDVELRPNETSPEIGDWLSEEIQSFDFSFPSEEYLPHTILDLFPEIENGVPIEQGEVSGSDAETLMVEIPSSSDAEPSTFVNISRGDAYSAMSDRWYCAWVDEYLIANKAPDSAGESQALESFEAFHADKTAQELSINLETYQEDIYNLLVKGETAPATSLVKACQPLK